MRRRFIFLFLLLFVFSNWLCPAISVSERNALIALYNSTDGDNWNNNTNWLKPGDPTQFNDPGTENTWFGITCNGDNTHVTKVEFNNNGLSGTIPSQMNSLTDLTVLDLRYNQLSGTIPDLSTLNQLVWLRLGSNNLSGSVPTWLNSLTLLYHIDLAWNQLSGSIPSLINITGLGYLSLGNNELTGTIPTWMNSFSGLLFLNLEGNQLSGEIPVLSSLTTMRYLYLSNNSFTGSIPSWLNNFSSLYYLELRDNQLSGSIPDLSNLSQLQILDLGWNQLSGGVPAWLNSLTNLNQVNLRNNQLTGAIPDLSNLSGLEYLYLNNNRLSGSIPTGIGSLTALKYLYLHSNALTGDIPTSLSNLTNLYGSANLGLNISYNGLYTNDSSLRDFLNSKHAGGEWENTQTVAPTGLTIGEVTETTVSISWELIDFQSYTGGYRVFYSTTPGSDYILSGITDDKTINNYTVTGLEPGTSYYFVVRSVTNPHSNNQNTVISEYSSEVYSDTEENATITVTSPNGGEELMQEDPYYISWTYEGPVNNVNLYYSSDGGSNWDFIDGPIANNGGYDWIIPTTPSNQCIVKVVDDDGKAEDVSDNTFVIRSPTISITSPIGGEVIMQEDPWQINWTYEGHVENVILSYSYDGGSNWTHIDGPIPNTGSYDWIIPTTPSEQCLVRVADVAGYAEDVNDGYFTIRSPVITIGSPNGGEIIMQEDPWQINWTWEGHVDYVMLHYSFDGGNNWTQIAGPIPNTGAYDWIIPTTASTSCLVRVSDINGFAEDFSDDYFTIRAPTITINSPNGGEIIMQEDPWQINWTWEGHVDYVILSYSFDGGSQWANIEGPIPNTGYYDWIIPTTASTQCMVRVADVNGFAEDFSDDYFTIRAPTITINSPNGGEIIMQEDPWQINWTWEGHVDYVILSYSFDGGSQWANIEGPIPNTGYYDWIIPPTPSEHCMVRVADVNGFAEDFSDSYFVIRAPTITIQYPNGGELFMQEDPIQIHWEFLGHVENVDLSYSFDGGATWAPIAGPIPNSGYYDWVIPTTPSNQCMVRVVDNAGYAEDFSDSYFTIMAPTITVAEPNGGEVYMANDTGSISWSFSGNISSVNLYYSTDGGSSWITVAESVPNSGSYSWIIPNTASGNCLARVSDTAGFAQDDSDGAFTILIPGISSLERDGLIALYNSTNGDSWLVNTNWRKPGDPSQFNDPGTENTWFGVTCNVNNDNVIALNLVSNNLVGSIPTEVNDFTSITTINFTGNQLSGAIPFLGDLVNLTNLSVADNQLTGSIPTSLNSLTSLTTLDLSNNLLSGAITTLDNLLQLNNLLLASNQLTGSIPTWLNSLTGLTNLNLSFNQLSGNLPDLSALTVLNYLSVAGNQLTGSIPQWLGSLENLTHIILSGNLFTGSIPMELGSLTNLEYLSLGNNQLTGSIPVQFSNLNVLNTLSLENNQLSGAIPVELSYITTLTYLDLKNNRFNGTLPPELGNLTGLTVLRLAGNQFLGEVPGTFAYLTNLSVSNLDLRWNGLYTSDSGLSDFLNSRQESGSWEGSQTIAPDGIYQGIATETSIEVTWSPITYSQDSGVYNIYYSTTSGSGYTLAGSTADKTIDNYTVTGLDSGETYYFIVETVTYPHSNNQNTVTSEPGTEMSASTTETASLTLTSPNGGEVWDTNSQHSITWNTIGSITPVELFLSLDGGSTWNTIDGMMPNDGSFAWTVPQTSSNLCLIRVQDSEGLIVDESDSFFTIQGPSVTITSPNGGEIWDMGSSYTITWTTTGSLLAVELFYSTDNGGSWNTVDGLMPNEGYFNWTVPNIPSSQCLIRVTDSIGTVMDDSDSPFTILAPTITVLTPNGGEVWQAGSQQEITWSYTGNLGAVEFYYSIDNGSTWAMAEPLTPNTGSFTWTIPNTPSSQCLVRINDGNNLAVDQSNNTFTILAEGLDSGERDALIALYNSTNGDNWTNNTNWRKPGDPSQFNDPGTEHTWFGITCNALNTHVTGINLQDNNLLGTLPDLNGLSEVETLNLSVNGLSGSLPGFSGLTKLTALNLYHNSLSGSIPDLSTLVSLTSINLAYNQLNGSIPAGLNNLTNLISLELYSNDLTGVIPDLSSLSSLSLLDLSANQLDGNIPASLNVLTNLTVLNLRANALTGAIPDLSSLSALTSLNFTTNQLSGSIPSWLNNLTNLQVLHLGSNQLSGSIPDLGNLTQLTVLSFGVNLLSGSFPAWVNNCPNLKELYVSSNSLSGDLPDLGNLTQLEMFSAMDNEFTGSITNVAALTQAKNIYLENNRLSGSLPSALSNLSTLEKLHLEGNMFSGEIPASLINLTTLQTGGLDIRFNSLYTGDSGLRDFLNSKQYTGYWESTQTIAPSGFSVSEETTDSVLINWSPITYTLHGGGYNVYYTTTSGSGYQLAGSTTSKTESNYTVTGLTPNTTYYFVVDTVTDPNSDNKNTVTSEYSNEFLAVTLESLELTITSPNGGESWLGFSGQVITWTSTPGIENVMIEYSADNGSSWNTITTSTPNSGSYNWTVPNTPSSACLLRITDTAGPTTDSSDSVFNIIEYRTITLSSPNGGESWEVASGYSITWSSTGNVVNVMIEYSPDNGSTWETVTSSTPNTGSFEWVVPNTPSVSCLVRISDTAGPASDTSDAVFNILVQRTLTLTSPNGGETWLVASTYPLTWASTGAVANVSLEFSSDGGSTWGSIISAYANSGSYDWTVPETVSSDCLIRITDMEGSALDTSDSVFSTSVPMIPQAERDALIAFYNSTRGQYWYNKTNWLKPGDPTQFNEPGTEYTWFGITCSADRTHVTKIIFSSNNLSGSLPDLSDLTELTTLNLRTNHFTSSIPASINNLTNLTYLGLYSGEFTGSIPDLGNLSQLVTLDLGYNELTGNIPASLGLLTNLEYLQLNSNQLDGSVPDLSNLTNLNTLRLNNNNLSGTFPTWLNNFSNLYSLNLSYNQLSGSISALSGMTNLISLYLNDNLLSGSVPDITGSPNLTYLYLSSNQLSGDLPASLTALSHLDYLRLHHNQLTGSLPDFSSFPNAIELNFENNQFSGSIPSVSGNFRLQYLYLGSNQLTGTIPLSICSKTSLRVLELQSNQLTGSIPDLSGLTSLTTLDLSDNQLTGSFPDVSASSSLRTLNVFSNQLSGTVPAWVGNLSSLTTIGVQFNQFSGALPELNKTGILKINFSHNQFSGPIPATIGARSTLTDVYLNDNQLDGSIPVNIGYLHNVKYLYLNGNKLSGSIPDSLADLGDTLINGSGLNLSWNGLFTVNTTLRDLLNTKQLGGDWESTQTIAPSGLAAGEQTPDSLNISWTPIAYTGDSGGYRVYYSTTSGDGFTLAGSTSDKSTDNYTVSGLTGNTTYYFVVESFTDSHVNNQNTITSDYSTELSASTLEDLTITVTSPNGGETYEGGSVQSITWTTTGNISDVKLEYSTDSGTSWNSITASTLNTGSFNWTVANTPSTNCLIKITDAAGTVSDSGDSVFTIVEQRTITVTAPNGGETWEGGFSQSVTWSSTGSITTVNLEYSIDSGVTWNPITTSVTNSGSYTWSVPNAPSTGCLIRISDTAGVATDTSDAAFTIVEMRTITVSSPNGGESWGAYSSHDITWVTTGAVGSVNIDYSTDNGATWNSIVSVTPNSGTYSWQIPLQLSSECLIRINDPAGPAIDTSDAVFSITEPVITALERDALIALYNSTNGDLWTNNTNWRKPGDPSQFNDPGTENTWFGITLTADSVSKIELSNNNLNGSLPNLQDLTGLNTLNLSINTISGNIPTWLNQLTSLEILNLESNQFDGSLPNLGNLVQLQQLVLGNNSLSGDLPTWLNNLTQLTHLRLGNNTITGTFPDLTGLTLLRVLDLKNNQLTGSIPVWLNQLVQINSLDLSTNQFSGTIPDLSNLTTLAYFYLQSNQLTGSIPTWLNTLTNLRWINLNSNQLTGTIPDLSNLPLLTSLYLNSNQLTGSVPAELGSMTQLQYLTLYGNQLSGSIPAELGYLVNLKVLTLYNNHLSGGIPAELGNLTKLYTLGLQGNQLTGSLPDSLIGLTTLFNSSGLNISYNGLYTSNSTLRDFLNSKHLGNNWEDTQTIAPEGISTGDESYDSIKITWSPISFQAYTGGYRVYYSTTAGSGFTLAGMTTDKTIDNYTVTGLSPETTYYFVVESITEPHTYNSNTVTSDSSVEVSSSTLVQPSITVSVPNNGENWEVASTQTISWTSTGSITDVKIEYSADNGSTWSTVIASTTNSGSYDWVIPNTPAVNCLVKISDLNETAEDVSDAVFTIAEQRTLALSAPNGGESWEGNTAHNITWTSTGTIPNVMLEYSTDNGSSWITIIASVSNSGSYNWTVPNTPSGNCLVRVSDSAGSAADVSNGVFTIAEFRTVTVTAPNGGESWEGGSGQTITWASTGNIANVDLNYSLDNGVSWNSIAASVTNSGSYSWTVPNAPSTGCLVKVSDTAGTASDSGDGVFTIVEMRTLTLTAPNGGERWFVDSSHSITWTSTGTIATVLLEYSIDNGGSWATIINSTANTGNYSWTIPNTSSVNCLVRVSDTSGPALDTSNNSFTIEPFPTISVSTPNGGESWVEGNTQSITWTNTGTINNVSIEYSINSGSTWNTITGSIANTGSYSWVIPSVESSNCLVRISDTETSASDNSDSVFSLWKQPSITVTTPNGGEVWKRFSTQTITWNTTGIIQDVKIQYTQNGGSYWYDVVSSMSNTGSYQWYVPSVNQTKTQCLVRIMTLDGTVVDSSDSYFTISKF